MSNAPQSAPEDPGANRSYRASYIISASSREKVFAALLEVEHFTRWASGLRRARLLGAHRAQPGAGIEFTVSAAGLTHRVVSEITRVEPPRLLEWRYTAGALGEGGWLVEEEGSTSVRITFSTDYEIQPAWLDRIAHRPFFRRVTGDLLRRSIRSLARHLEKS